MSLSSNEVVDEQLTQLLEKTNSIRRYFTEPYPCWPLMGGWEEPTHYLIRNSLKVHYGLDGCNVVTWIVHSIIRNPTKAS